MFHEESVFARWSDGRSDYVDGRGASSTLLGFDEWTADENGESQSHAWRTSSLEGYVRYILGICPLKPQYEEVLIKPLDFGSRLDWAKGTIPADRAPISVHWVRNGKMYGMQLDLPVNVTARVALPRRSGTVYVDDVPVKATPEGDYLIIDPIGSGHHTIGIR